MRTKMVEKQKLRIDLAHKNYRPDFNPQYTWQPTAPTHFHTYYMLTVGVTVPILSRSATEPDRNWNRGGSRHCKQLHDLDCPHGPGRERYLGSLVGPPGCPFGSHSIYRESGMVWFLPWTQVLEAPPSQVARFSGPHFPILLDRLRMP